MKTTPKSSYNETMDIFNSTYIYIAPWTSETPPEGNPAPSPTSGSTQTPSTSTSSNTVEAHVSEMSTGLGKTVFPSRALTITTLLSPETGSMSALSVYTPRTEKKIVSTTSVTHSFSHRQDTSFVDTDHYSPFCFKCIYSTSWENFYDNVHSYLLDVLTANCLKSTSVATSGLGSEMSSMSVSVSAFPPLTVSSDASTTGGSFYTSSSVTPRPSMTMQTLSLDVTPLTYAGTEAISSIPKTTFSSFLSTAQQSSQRYQATTLGIFPGITNSSLSTVSSGKVIALTNTPELLPLKVCFHLLWKISTLP
ncbi:hypothetical protein Celaphus_00009557 [Cervus elaphus hippelaphus]|uniref:Uncharacterized protein n=1 Tax=Cervus elaphus hippelaphus TaxID=46360 RepID=A0A212C0Z8_CEREH|nr:hypothetical protein Celaphus_00009557 [Cervus elaphus hippelaphus]